MAKLTCGLDQRKAKKFSIWQFESMITQNKSIIVFFIFFSFLLYLCFCFCCYLFSEFMRDQKNKTIPQKSAIRLFIYKQKAPSFSSNQALMQCNLKDCEKSKIPSRQKKCFQKLIQRIYDFLVYKIQNHNSTSY